MTRYSIEFDDEDDEPNLVERDDVSICGRIGFDQFGEMVYFDCRPPEWMTLALKSIHRQWRVDHRKVYGMTRESSERRLIAQLSTAMTAKLALPRNRAKGTWDHMTRVEVLQGLEREFRELNEAVLGADCDDPLSVAHVEQECADVAATAGMILDLARNHWGRR